MLLRRIEAALGDAHVVVELDCRAELGALAVMVCRSADRRDRGRRAHNDSRCLTSRADRSGAT